MGDIVTHVDHLVPSDAIAVDEQIARILEEAGEVTLYINCNAFTADKLKMRAEEVELMNHL